MIIISQDKRKIVNTDHYAIVMEQGSDFEHEAIKAETDGSEYILGRYSSEEEAFHVMEYIADCIYSDQRTTFEMPTYSEVEESMDRTG